MKRLREILARMKAISAELSVYAQKEARGADLSDEDNDHIARLADEWDALNDERAVLQDREERLAKVRNAGQSEPGFEPPQDPARFVPSGLDPYTADGRETMAQVRSRALTAIEGWDADDELKESATRTLEHTGQMTDEAQASRDVTGVARHILRFGHPLYASAFRKYAADPEGYLADLTPDEGRIWREARVEARATLDTTGAVLPAPLDPSIVLTNVGAIDPMRQVARVDTTTSKTKTYVTSAGSDFSYDAEGAEASDDTPTLSDVEITTEKGQGWIEATIEAFMDQPNFSTEVARIIADAKMRADAPVFINGTGSDEPFGLITRLDGSASEVAPDTGETFQAVDVYNTIEDLPARWRAAAVWMAELSTVNDMDQFETANGAKLFPGLDADEPRLLRRRLYENSSMDAAADLDPAVTADNFLLLVGDFTKYVILDRVGVSVFFVGPGHLRGASGRPDGRVGWYAYWRTGADRLTVDAFRVLSIPTTA